MSSLQRSTLPKQQQKGKGKGEILAILLMNFKLSMVSINLHDYSPSIRTRGKLTSLNGSDQLEVNLVCHCDGLVLCVIEDYTRFVVWNQYTGQNRWICAEPIPAHHRGHWYGHALGYDKSSHKVLRFLLNDPQCCLHEIYHANSNSRRVLDVTPDWQVEDDENGLSLKGNTYWYAQDTVILSSVREEQLAVLFQNCNTCEMEIWVTTKIEPNAVSWSKFFVVDMYQFTNQKFPKFGNFIVVDEEKKAVVVFDDGHDRYKKYSAYFIGENGHYTEVEIGVIMNSGSYPFAFSYVPSSLQINQPA